MWKLMMVILGCGFSCDEHWVQVDKFKTEVECKNALKQIDRDGYYCKTD